MIYYARSKNESGQYETIKHHLQRVAQLCAEYTSEFGCPYAGEWMGILHDFGKYSELFQQVLKHKEQHLDHSFPSAVFLVNKLCRKKYILSKFWPLAVCIRNHHGTLNYDFKNEIDDWAKGNNIAPDGNRYSIKATEFLKACNDFLSENKLPVCKPDLPEFERCKSSYYIKQQKMILTRMLFSALTDADYSASAEHFSPEYLTESSIPSLDPCIAWNKLESYRKYVIFQSNADPSIDEMRNKIFEYCKISGQKFGSGIYTLTAPTGSGKTLSMLAFGIQQMLVHGKKRIIVVLPYLSIIEQNAAVYRNIIPEVLEDHSQAERNTNIAKELSQRWDAPFIITTAVKFFESMFSCTGPACRKLHRLADSVILFDEAQSLPPQLAKTTIFAIKEFAEHYNATIVFSTATQPAFEKLPDVDWHPSEIIPDTQDMFTRSKRVHTRWMIDRPINFSEICDEVYAENNVCIIVNLRKHAQKIYDMLCEQHDVNDVYLLTTDLCPAHRTSMLNRIKDRLKRNAPCYLVSTQCIEAGVDISFSVMYRALSPLESIIQAAGRCNRNDARTMGNFTVFLPDEFYHKASNAVLTLSARHVIDINSLSHIREYYSILFGNGQVHEKSALTEAIESMDFFGVSNAYKLIDAAQLQILVPYSEKYTEYLALADEGRNGISHSWMRRAAPLTVQSYQKELIENCCEAIYVYEGKERLRRFSGWYILSNKDYYDEKKGLQLKESFSGVI